MDRIESTKNPRIKAARALHTVKGRDESGMFLCEGEHMVQEAVRAANTTGDVGTAFTLGSVFAVDTLFVDEALEDKYADLIEEANADHAFLVPDFVMEAISTVKSPQGIVAVVRLQTPQILRRDDLGVPGVSPAVFGISPQDPAEATEYLFDELVTTVFPEDGTGTAPPSANGQASPASSGDDSEEPEDGKFTDTLDDDALDADMSPSVLGDRLVLLEAVQDPGNVGAILRTMDAAGFDGMILAPGCADPFSPKALRATMGSVFRVPTMQTSSAARAAAALREEGYAVVAAALDGGDFYNRESIGDKVCLIIGNEGAGITDETLREATHRFRLPMRGGAESLNAAAAAAVFIYELAYRS